MAPKLILLFDRLGAADKVLELDRISSTGRMLESFLNLSNTKRIFATGNCVFFF